MRGSVTELEAIVLRSVDYRESDRIVGLLSSAHGKISAFAPSARMSRRRFGGGLDLFARVRAFLRPPRSGQSSLWRLDSIELLDPHFGLRRDLRRLATASYLAECLWLMAGEGDPQPALFDWWKDFLGRLDRWEGEFEADPAGDLELLALLGYAPRWNRCAVCGERPRGDPLFFSFERGSVCCRTCRGAGEGRWLRGPVAARLREGGEVPPEERLPLQRILDGFVTYTLGKRPKSQPFRDEVFGGHG